MSTDDHGNELGKIFVGGLHQSTSNDSLRNYFSTFGEVQDASVMMDHRTCRSRGFGYVRFSDNETVNKIMSIKKHILDGKEIDPKPCNVNMKGKSRRSLKIFVGGIAPDHNEDMLRDFFKQYGTVTELTLMKDPGGHRHRGFAFVAFDEEEVVKRLISEHFLTIGNKQVEIKQMEPQLNRNNQDMGMTMMPNKRGMTMNQMQGQWPQWASNTAAWPTTAGWQPWPQHAAAAGAGPNLWDQTTAGWAGGWGNPNAAGGGMGPHIGRGHDIMGTPWDGQIPWAGQLGPSGMQAGTNSWGQIANGGWDQSMGLSMAANNADWRSNLSNGMNASGGPMHGQTFTAFKR